MTSTISEAKFEALKSKLRELFELDKSDLDFGIYRIMAAKNKEVTAFLDRHLKEAVREVLAERGSDEAEKVKEEIEAAREAAKTAGFNPDDSPKVKELEEKYQNLGGGSTAELEADIYNHLLNFFSRYYDEGDFISKRFYKGDTYAIPYGGEEVTLHWANKDQYYIKSGEWHKDYRFRIGDRTVHFRLVDATQESGNNKEADESKRRYILATENPVFVDEKSNTLILRFEFRTPTEEDEKRVEETEATRIFGGNYDKGSSRKKGDEREGFCADAECRALEAITDKDWKNVVGKLAGTDAKPKRTIFGKYLDHFTARNAFDYFIHKDLGGFLQRELDFYIKNEVLRLDDIESLSDDHLLRIRGKINAIRKVALHLIDFFESLEAFQRKLWLKKKFVLNTSWLVSVSKIPSSLHTRIVANERQWQQWESLGFREDRDDASLPGIESKWGSVEYIVDRTGLVVDTSLFDGDDQFCSDLLAALGDSGEMSEELTGELIKADCFHAATLLRYRYSRQCKCIYNDPPYNTGNDSFVYKDGLSSSSWHSMISSRLAAASHLLDEHGILFVSFDDHEVSKAIESITRSTRTTFVTNLIWQNVDSPNDNKVPLTPDHEYILLATRDVTLSTIEQFPDESILDAYRAAEDGTLYRDRLLKKNGANSLRVDRPTMYFGLEDPDGNNVFPLHDDGREACWAHGKKAIADLDSRGDLIWKRRIVAGAERWEPYSREYAPESPSRPYPSIWNDVKTMRQAKSQLKALFGSSITFPTVKPRQLLSKLIRFASSDDTVIADFFAGTGTTADAVVSLNREDNGKRRFIAVEVGPWFDAILRPRICKISYSDDWDKGFAKNHDASVPLLCKSFALESYEDALNNLPSPDGKLFEAMDQATRDSLITYSLDLELGPHLLNMDAFKDPWGYQIYAQLAGEDEVSLHSVDMVETFNYLIGLKVHAYGPIERYNADFVQLPHGDDTDGEGNPAPEKERQGKVRVDGRLRRDPEGPFVYQRIEGELNDGNATRVLVIWRKLTDNPDQDAAVLEAWMARHRETTKERTEHRDYHLIYINGPVTLPQPTQELRTVLPTEQTFKDRMFEDTEV